MRRVLSGLVVGLTAAVLFSSSPASARHSPCIALHEAAFMDEPDVVSGLLAQGVSANCLNELGHTPLVTAVEGNSAESVAVLLAHGADPKVLNGFGQTPLQQARGALGRLGYVLPDGQPTQLTLLIKKMIEQLEKAENNNL